ncbi:MAG: PH domain-containing protein [Acidimicrobiales bacterium]
MHDGGTDTDETGRDRTGTDRTDTDETGSDRTGRDRTGTDCEPAWLVPSPGLWRMRRAEVGALTLLLATLAGIVFGAAVSVAAGVVSAVVIVVLGLVTAWFVHRRFGAWRYQERHEDLMVARGVMVQRLSVVPYGRMQFVELTAGPVERLFKLSTVKLHTAAAASDARIPGLERDEAVRLRERLTELGESHAAGL